PFGYGSDGGIVDGRKEHHPTVDPPWTRLQLADGRIVRRLSLVHGNNFDKPRVRGGDGAVVELASTVKVQRIID
ncbi:MAG: hypothetical protein KAI47_25560, partial [Deltaproteobacteria bacterium]|nr:hypothetical protein [Deltaproteobacteria bacterium]